MSNFAAEDLGFIERLDAMANASFAPIDEAERAAQVLAAADVELTKASWRIEDQPNDVLAEAEDIANEAAVEQGELIADYSLLDRMRGLDDQTIAHVTGIETWSGSAYQTALEAAAKMLEERNNPHDKE